jgi:hypothetical protein
MREVAELSQFYEYLLGIARPKPLPVSTPALQQNCEGRSGWDLWVGRSVQLPACGDSTRRPSSILFEINRFQVVINLVAGLGYCGDRLFNVLYQRAKAAASSAQEEGAYLRIRCDIFGAEVVFVYIFASW